MLVFLSNRSKTITAEGIYDTEAKSLVIKAGAKVSDSISNSPKFGGVNKIKKLRETYCNKLVTIKDIEFKSASTAANFVLGTSTNGLLAWKDSNGNKLKDII